MKIRNLVVVALTLVAMMALPVQALAAPARDGQVILGGNFTLASGETLTGDLVVLGGNATLEKDSHVTGTVFQLGGNLVIDGLVDGDVGLLGGTLNLGADANVRGNVSLIGGTMQRAEGAQIGGQVMTGQGLTIPFRGGSTQIVPPTTNLARTWTPNFSPLWSLAWGIFRSLLMGVLAIVAVMFMPDATRRISLAIVSQPLAAGGIGLVSYIIGIPLIVLFAITICLIPVSLLLGFGLALGWVLGSVALGLEVGERLAVALKTELQPVLAAGLGTTIVSLLVVALNLIPCFGWVGSALIACLALGGALLTRFGTRAYLVGPPPQPAEA
jgi:hypothetical protein